MMSQLRLQPPGPIDVDIEPHLTGVFAPIYEETDAPNLRVEGELPAGLEGDFLRNGPNPRFAPLGSYLYPLDGDGMLHRVQLRGGTARYTNRFVWTPALSTEEASGSALWPGFGAMGYTPGPNLVGPALAYTRKDTPSINIVRHAGRMLALAESRPPFLMSNDLDTIGQETFGELLPAGMTAHPKIDPTTGEMVVFCYHLRAPFLTWSVIDRDGRVSRADTPIDGLDRPVLIHDMALTSTYVVLIVAPLFFDIAAALGSGSPLSWEPDQGTRIALIPRDGGPVRWMSTNAFWLSHTANAYDELAVAPGTGAERTSPDVVLDFAEWAEPEGFTNGERTNGSLVRLRLRPDTGVVHREVLSDRAVEFPRVDDRVITRQHRVIGASLRSASHDLSTGDHDTLGWYDFDAGRMSTWRGDHLALGEQVFAPDRGHDDQQHGWWLTIATDRNDLTSRMLIFPAEQPSSGPVATIHLPQRVPHGMHGTWQPSQD
jgi:carotenoid cleavage dioxygenase-like enzyme